MKYDKLNRERLNQLGDKTKVQAYKLYQYCLDNDIDILVVETIRTLEKQKQYFADKKSQTLRSYHLVGQALDVAPVLDGEVSWKASDYTSPKFYAAIKYAKALGFTWGGDWDNDGYTHDESFVDMPHLQYDKIGYGKDTFVNKGQTPVIVQETAKPKANPLPTPLVEKGDRGQVVRDVQYLLNKKGYKLAVDGIFGNGTLAAVHSFQKKNGLAPDGIVGRKTWAKLRG